MQILVIDNYDSFTYNLVHLLEACSEAEITVKQNKEVDSAYASNFDKIVLSPGPGLPSEAGNMPEIIRNLAPSKSMLGVCLGWQAIAENFQTPLRNLKTVVHGQATPIKVLQDDVLFDKLPKQFSVGRYHSWVADAAAIHAQLQITAVDLEGNIMAGRHRHLPLRGVQFHPESILSEYGKEMISNWLNSR